MKPVLLLAVILFSVLALTETSLGQEQADPAGAFVRSMVFPGWGHSYIGADQRERALVHAGTEIALILTAYGLYQRGNNLRGRYETLSSLRAGADLSGRDRSFQIAVGDFNSLADYNDFQLRSRNWDRVLDDTPENRWQWNSREDRERYRDLRSGRDTIRNQIPAIFGFMVVNRVVSAISAYNRAGALQDAHVMIYPLPSVDGARGAAATLTLRF